MRPLSSLRAALTFSSHVGRLNDGDPEPANRNTVEKEKDLAMSFSCKSVVDKLAGIFCELRGEKTTKRWRLCSSRRLYLNVGKRCILCYDFLILEAQRAIPTPLVFDCIGVFYHLFP